MLGFVCVAVLAQGQVTTGLAITKTCPGPGSGAARLDVPVPVHGPEPGPGTNSVNTLAVQNEVPFPGGVVTPYPCMQGGVPVTVLGPYGSGTDTCNGAADETAPACGPVAFFYTDQVSATGMDENGGGIPLPVSASTTNQVLIDACTTACPSCPMPTHALETVVSNCAGPQVTTTSGWTQINLPGADVVLQCALTQRPGTDGVRIIAHSIKVDGVNGGSVTSTGKNGIQLSAGTVAPSACDARRHRGHRVRGGSRQQPQRQHQDHGLRRHQRQRLEPQFGGSRGQRDLDERADLREPRHLLRKPGQPGGQRRPDDDPVASPDHRAARPDRAHLGQRERSRRQRAALREPLQWRDRIQLHGDGGLNHRPSYACIDIAEDITITARGEDLACGTTTIVNLANAEIRNDFGKTGVITVTACGGSGRIDINNALLVDEGKKGGGPDPNRVSSLNGGTATTNVNCAATTVPTCNARPLNPANNPVSADQMDRGAHHVIGVPRCDT